MVERERAGDSVLNPTTDPPKGPETPAEGSRRYRIGVVPGDGIGPEVIVEAIKVLEATGVPYELVHYDLGAERFLRTGEVLPDSTLEEWKELDALLLGAVGRPDVPPGILERDLLLRARFGLDLYVNLRPVRLLDGVPSPLAGRTSHEIDFVVVRENSEGLYAGAGGALRVGAESEIAVETSLNTYLGARRCCDFAFRFAKRRNDARSASGSRKAAPNVCLVHKTNVLVWAGRLWSRAFEEAHRSCPDNAEIQKWYCHVDAACLYMVTDPSRFDVVVTENLFGDILTDLGAAIAGGLGFAASGNINPETRKAIFEPVHGSAPDIAGTGRANPIAAIMSAAMLLDFVGEATAAERIDAAVREFVKSHPVRQGGVFDLPTTKIGDIIAASVG